MQWLVVCAASRRRRLAVANALPAGVERRRRLWVRLARSITSLGSRAIACAVPQRRQTKEANRRGSTGNSVTGLLGRRQESSTHRFCDSAPRLVCRPRDAPLRARYWLHRGTHCSWRALSRTSRSDSCIGQPCHAAEDELGPARLATLLGILSALGRRSKTHRAQQRAATRSAPAPSFEAQ